MASLCNGLAGIGGFPPVTGCFPDTAPDAEVCAVGAASRVVAATSLAVSEEAVFASAGRSCFLVASGASVDSITPKEVCIVEGV